MEEIIFRRKHPTVAEYCEKWLLMQSAKVSASTLRGYTRDMTNYIIKPLGEMYMEEVTADDIRLALVPLSKKSEGLYNKVNMLLKCIFYAAERNQILEHNPCAGISGKGGKPTKKKEALTDQQVQSRDFLHICLLCSVCIPVCVGKKFLHCNGIVYFWTRIHLIYR